MKKLLLTLIIIGVLITAFGCIKSDYEYLEDETTQYFTPAEQEEPAPDNKETQSQEFQPADKVKQTQAAPSGKMIIVNEGELVKVNVQGKDLDGDLIIYTFSEPLDENGEWQTQEGDAGNYLATVTASDGKSSTSKSVPINVLPRNDAPVIMIEDLTVSEGDLITLSPVIQDDSTDITITYSGWLSTPEYQTTHADAGTHQVTVTADDGSQQTSKTITITVNNINRGPIVEDIMDITAKEGETIWVKPNAQDPDNDVLSYTFESPLDEAGKWTTKIGDKGTYGTKVIISDGNTAVTKEFKITINPDNLPPTLQPIQDITLNEGQTLTINPIVTDPENDELTVTYSGWITSGTYKTSYEDSGVHTVTISVTDGINIVKQDIKVTVNEINRAPTFDIIV